MKTFCFKLYRSDHNNALKRLIDIAASIYNHCIALHKRYYKIYGKYIHKYRLQKHITKLKRTSRFAYFRRLNAQVIHDITDRIDRAYNLFWSNIKRGIKSSPPKFKKIKQYKSFTLSQNGWKPDKNGGAIIICGHRYRHDNHRSIEGRPKTVTVKRDAVGDIYVYICCDVQSETVEARSGKSVGFDFGLKRFLTASNGQDIECPNFFALNAQQIKTKCRKLSRKLKGSHNRERARKDLAKAYRRLSNQRHDFHFKLAHQLCMEYTHICLETLNIKAIAKL